MQNTISLKDWLEVIDTEYLSSFVRNGGASIKFAVTPEKLKAGLYKEAEAPLPRTRLSHGQFGRKGNAGPHAQDFFFRFARQVDWRLMARRLILRLACEQAYKVREIDPSTTGVFDAIAKANGLEPEFVLREIRPEIQNTVTRNTNMAKDFRVCMSHLCIKEYTRGEYTGQPLLDWLKGDNTRISSVRPFSIYSSINRTTARYFIESALYWIHHSGCAGTVILFDNSRVTVARNPRGRVEILQ